MTRLRKSCGTGRKEPKMVIPGEQAPNDTEENIDEAVTDLDEARTQAEEKNAEPVEGFVKEYDEDNAPSERKMSEMERVKDENAQEGFDSYARTEEREKVKQKESTVIGKLRRFLGGK